MKGEIPSEEAMKLLEAQQVFLSRCHSQNLSELTIDWYTRKLKMLSVFLTEKSVCDIESVSAIHIREYLSLLRQNRQSSETVFRTWGALKCFFNFLHLDNICKDNPMVRVEKPRRVKSIITPMSILQIHTLLAQPNTKVIEELRDKVLMLLMADSGLRLSEAISLRIDKIFWKDGLVTVMGKGRKERVIPIGETTKRIMGEYAAVRKPNESPYFFLTRRGYSMKNRYVQVAMKKYGKMAGITGVRVSPHTLRHSFAIMYILNGGDAFSLQNILGHSTLDMVRNYVNLAQNDVTTQYRKFSPIDHAPVATV